MALLVFVRPRSRSSEESVKLDPITVTSLKHPFSEGGFSPFFLVGQVVAALLQMKQTQFGGFGTGNIV